ncbi:protein ALTERED XYLOGLUCAN 4-like [Iris pallida]|uniref:Protein ALTERED XYLOGLUCAN 4-like n=1 Tax=Iris pallida TaxID=29817 RepID=A0AAX6FNU5_IRIPA|nr:protein ALTERED XYLOGLUCAN 4-like [Iris pallida]
MKSSTTPWSLQHIPEMNWRALLMSVLVLSSVSILFIVRSSNPFSVVEQLHHGLGPSTPTSLANTSSVHSNTSAAPHKEEEECDLFVGKWVAEPRGSSLYSNWSCPTIPDQNNCGKFGKGSEHLYWKWKPDRCELPRLDPVAFLRMVRGKKMAFAGDSVARNHMDSLLCLLSQAETPTNIYKDGDDKFQTWYFPSHNFTLMVIWAEFLVERAQTQRMINGVATNSYDLYLDRVNPDLARELPALRYVVISAGNWFIKKLYLHENGSLVGCVNCRGENLTELDAAYAYRRVFRTVLQSISKCEQCDDDLLTMLRTFSPTHFEHGSWFNGGYCNRTQPMSEGEIDLSGNTIEYRNIQFEEMGRIKGGSGGGRGDAKRGFELLDVTKAMMARADGHPGSHWRWMQKSNSDCLHWCLPGPIDMWNDALFANVKKHSSTTQL